jgi:hypothetical protein
VLLSAILALVALALALLVAELTLPRIGAARIRNRLTEGGGQARVEVASRPALRLLRNAGDRLEVRGEELVIGIGEDSGEANRRSGLSALDGFAEVDIELVNFRAGPLAVEAFVLTRTGGGSYAMAAEGTTTGQELIRYGDPWLRTAIPGGGLLGAVAVGVPSTPITSWPVRVSIEIELLSDRGGLRVRSGGGSIAGYPAGPIATTIAAAVARRLEIVP